jgi:hypothetical protein
MGAEFGKIAANLKLAAVVNHIRSEGKAELMQKAEMLIDQLLDWEEPLTLYWAMSTPSMRGERQRCETDKRRRRLINLGGSR